MRRFVALFGREVRDARWHLVTSFAAAVLLTWVVQKWFIDGADASFVAIVAGGVMVPILFGLFAVSLASDLVARDVMTRRIDALVLLPAPLGQLWRAKTAFWLSASLLFLAWVIAAQWLTITNRSALVALPKEIGRAVPWVLAGLAAGAASLLFSTLVERGVSAAVAALGAVIAAFAAIQWAAIPTAPGAAPQIVAVVVPTAIALACIVGSWRAFVRGPVHFGSKLRLAATAAAAAAFVLVPCGTACAAALALSTRLDAHTWTEDVAVSPDGKWIAIERRDVSRASEVWIYGVADGSLRRVAGSPTQLSSRHGWTAGCMLNVQVTTFSLVNGPCRTREVSIEPTGLVVGDEHGVGDIPPYELPVQWADVRVSGKSDDPTKWTVRYAGPPQTFTGRALATGPERGIVYFVTESGALVRQSLLGGPPRELAKIAGGSVTVSRDGSKLLLDEGTASRVVDAREGTVLFDGWKGRAKWVSPDDDRWLLLWRESVGEHVMHVALHDLHRRVTIDLGERDPFTAGASTSWGPLPRVGILHDGRIVLSDGVVWIYDPDGKRSVRVFPPEEN